MKYTDYQLRAIVVIALSIISSACGGGGVGSSSSRIDGTIAEISPPNTWPRVGGSNVQDAGATYGTQDTTSMTDFPGVQQAVVTWTDSSANPRLGGGADIDANGTVGVLNDHLKYYPATSQRTTVTGSSSGNAVTVYGTRGTSRTRHRPSAAESVDSFTDASDQLSMFRGSGPELPGNAGYSRDVRRNRGPQRQWTRVSGGTIANPSGIRATRGTKPASSVPAGRDAGVFWLDASGNLWLLGGPGSGSAGNGGD
jgi:hypothetical protein